MKSNGSVPAGRGRQARALLEEHGIVPTVQRERIARAMLSLGRHVDAEQLHAAVRPKIGLATVYRTLQLFKEKGLVEQHDFGDGCRRYESSGGTHHDHLVCLGCGEVIEFHEPGIEALQERAAADHDFQAVSHRLELYGYCRRCRGGEKSG